MPPKSVSKSERNDLRSLIEMGGRSKREVVDFCMKKGLIASSYECAVCGRGMKLCEAKNVDGFEWRCDRRVKGEKHCVRRSIRRGSWFEESKLSMIDVLIVTYAWVEKHTNAQIRHLARVNKNTVTDWMNFCREVCMCICVHESSSLGGEGKIVEIDESLFGKRKYNRGKRVNGKWVFGGVERGSNECFFEVVGDRTKETLLEIIKRRILPGTEVISDYWRAYNCLQHEGYRKLRVNHKLHFKDPVTGAHTNTIEGLWSWIKRSLRGIRRVRGNAGEDEYDPYLAEFMWRKRHRNDHLGLTESFLRAVIRIYPPKMRDEQEQQEGGEDDGVSSDDDINRPGPSHKKTKCEEELEATLYSSDDDINKPGPSHKKTKYEK